MVIHMKKKTKLSELIFPNKKINYFVITILLLGVISGSIFLVVLNKTDKTNIVLKIISFMENINKGNINSGQAFKNSLIINYTFIILIWMLGLSIIGIIINIFLTYIKGFITGFSISSILLSYKYKGILASILYIFPSGILNIIVVASLTIYSIMFSHNLLKIIISKKNNNRLILKKYIIILIICIILSFISSILEVYLFPYLLKIIISLYIK